MDLRYAQQSPTQPQGESVLPSLFGGDEVAVFVDDTGRRARGVRLIGAAMATVCALWLAGLVLGVAGFSGFPVPRSPIGDLALARVHTAQATLLREEARADSIARAWRQRDVDTVGGRPRAVCLSDSGGVGVGTLVEPAADGAEQRGAGSPACTAKLPVAQHRDTSRLT